MAGSVPSEGAGVGWGLVPEPLGRAGGMLPTAPVSLPPATARTGPSGLPWTGQTVPSQREAAAVTGKLFGVYSWGTERSQGNFPAFPLARTKIPHQPPVKLSFEKLCESHLPPSSTQVNELYCSESFTFRGKCRNESESGARVRELAGMGRRRRCPHSGRSEGAAMSPPLAQEGSFPRAGL